MREHRPSVHQSECDIRLKSSFEMNKYHATPLLWAVHKSKIKNVLQITARQSHLATPNVTQTYG